MRGGSLGFNSQLAFHQVSSKPQTIAGRVRGAGKGFPREEGKLSPSRRSRSLRSCLLLILAACLVPACQKADPEACNQALETARKALSVEDFSLARQWRVYAWKQCDDRAQLTQLDKAIQKHEAAKTQREQAEVAVKRETQQLITLFAQWAAQHTAEPTTAANPIQCGAPVAPADTTNPKPNPKPATPKGKEQWCEGTRMVSKRYPLSVRYWEGEAKATRFTMRSPLAVKCEDFGAQVVREWQVPATLGRHTTRSHCEVKVGALTGMQLLVSDAINAEAHLFTTEYVERDAHFKALLNRQ